MVLTGSRHESDIWGDRYVRCFGWHAMKAREFVYTDARFHAPYLRGTQSNLIHRSTHEGWLVWSPENWYAYGQALPMQWRVKPVCSLPPIKNPHLLDKEGVLKQELVTFTWVLKVHPVLMLCGKCFPINEERTSHPLPIA